MPLGELHERVAAAALRAAAGHGFALGGSNALIAHGLIQRPTLDVDLFTDHEHGVEAAADAVEAALAVAGLDVERRDKTAGLSDIFPGMGEGLAEWLITSPSGEQMALQMAYFHRGRQPVVMAFGPVLDLEDALGGKVAALASRSYERDYWDTSIALERYTPAQLIGFARRLDPGLQAEDFADAGNRLDRMPDEAFADVGLTDHDIATLRARFAEWPREEERRVGREAREAGQAVGEVAPSWPELEYEDDAIDDPEPEPEL
jgi:Nucleotidyl transferase AbiEii toxin, Type IV TA system